MNLELAPTDDLIVELLGRFDHGVFAGLSIRDIPGDSERGDMVEYWRDKGNPRTCQGLCVGLMAHIQADVDDRYRPSTDDEKV